MYYHLLPTFLQVELTYACNSKCLFCYNSNHRHQHDDDTTEAILKEVNSYGISHVQLIGGEVTILPKLPYYLDLLSNIKWRSIVTNGRIYVDNLKGRIDEIYLSLHGDKEFHEKITKAKDSFGVIEDSIEKYVKEGIMVHSDTVLTKDNFHMMYDIGKQASIIGMNTLFVNIFQPVGIGSNNQVDLTPNIFQIREAITQLIMVRKDFGLKVRFGTSTPFCLDERLINEKLAFTCGTGDWFASISPTGELRICNQSSKSYGNVLEKPLNKIWHSQKVNSDYRNLEWIEEPCNSCVFKVYCLGGCRIQDNGVPRIDSIVRKSKDILLTQENLAELKVVYDETNEFCLFK